MRTDEETSVLAALRREPDQAALLLKLTCVTAVVMVAWDIMARWVLPDPVVALVLVLMLLAYGATMAVLVGKLMSSSRRWASGSAAAATRLSNSKSERPVPNKGIDLDALRRKPNELRAPDPETDGEPSDMVVETRAEQPAPVPVDDASAFNESYFMMRLQEQVKDARRQGHDMCVAAVHVTVPGIEMTTDIAQDIAYEMAKIAAGQTRMMSQPLALSDSEYVFSLPNTGPEETKQFVREIMRAFGDYWCYFGVATFPKGGHDAQTLVEQARAACEASRQGGKRGTVEYSAA